MSNSDDGGSRQKLLSNNAKQNEFLLLPLPVKM